ncbi:MAG: winged helix-turn-helix transcriptional regulator, partial [Burkholderiales bacterium]|nr:winged helix-turn-helix transcriptional regulator [Burkholderiales bacterium]
LRRTEHAATLANPAPARVAPIDTGRVRFDAWVLDVAARSLNGADGQPAALTGGEFDLLCVFVRHAGRVLSRDFLLEHTRGREAGPFDRTIDVQVGRLRRKLEPDADEPHIIKSVRGAGYLFVPRVLPG